MMNLWLTPKQSLRGKYWITTRKDWQLKTFCSPARAQPHLADWVIWWPWLHYEAKIVNQTESVAWPHVSYEWGMRGGRCQVIIPIGEAEREKNRQKERINSSCWLQCGAWSYLFVQECWATLYIYIRYFLNSDQRGATSLHGGELEKKYWVTRKMQCNGLPNIANISCRKISIKFAQMQKVITSNLHLGTMHCVGRFNDKWWSPLILFIAIQRHNGAATDLVRGSSFFLAWNNIECI